MDKHPHSHCRLSVNINKVALIRNSRGGNLPDLLRIAQDLEHYGAQGITVHPRPDERHIRYQDVRDLAHVCTTEFNVEGYPDRRWLDLVLETRPAQATLVPDAPDALTSSAGWDTITRADELRPILAELKSAGIRTSLFVEADPRMVEAAAHLGADRVELYTGPYAEQFFHNKHAALAPYQAAAQAAADNNLGLNAGHDLNLDNLAWFASHLPNLEEVSIGHALISDALYYGLENIVRMYREQLWRRPKQ